MTLDKKFRAWLDDFADQLAWPTKRVAERIGTHEVTNRLAEYPQLRPALVAEKIDPREFQKRASRCWALSSQYDAARLAHFSKSAGAIDTLQLLTKDFPADDTSAASRIDEFVERAIEVAYHHPDTNERFTSDAALLASVVLTTLYPERFVDIRKRRWKGLARELDYECPTDSSSSYGVWLLWAGKFAGEIAQTPTFRRYWPTGEPLWVIAGVCWDGMTKKGREQLLKHREEVLPEREYDEGKERMRWHRIRERNRTLVARAKQRRLETDPLLRCEVCEFSFVEFYGDLGKEFIEAHHRVPLAELRIGVKSKEEDLALVCANCHRMLHRGEAILTVEDLRTSIVSKKN